MTDEPSTAIVEADPPAPPAAGAMFGFGDPESVIDRRELAQFFEIWHNGRWYEPPIPLGKLAQAFNMSPYHRSAIALKVNMLVAQHVPSRWLDADHFERFALDFCQMGNAYFEWVPNLAGRLARVEFSPAIHTRVGIAPGVYWFVNGPLGQAHSFDAGRIFHLMQPDVAQELYGVPEWMAALQSGLLSENATLFRRRYYLNGAHAGFVFYVSEPLADTETVEAIEQKLLSAKGVGNFKNMFVYIPKGKKDGIQIMPIADVTAKDEFSAVKNISRDDLLAGHRTPPQLIGVIPTNNGGFGDVGLTRDNYYRTEIVPIMRRMLRVNTAFGVELLAFRPFYTSKGTVIHQDGTEEDAPRR
ncbi:phage portal protein [Sphingomonas sp.]|uniref:phage portal protein n=1 Tax=Sphingomonas sp. TaxID=28214 RepID=UPI003F720D0B